MKRKKGFTPPFAVMRQIGTSMEDQLVSGFARAIRSGTYEDGMKLPGVRKLAVAFSVSEITIRNAVKRLCREGLLAARPRIGEAVSTYLDTGKVVPCSIAIAFKRGETA